MFYLAFEGPRGYLKSVLDALDVPVASQTLVFSETSLQYEHINAANPRALYFNDRLAVGWVRGADSLELAAQDPQQGSSFIRLIRSPRASRSSRAANDASSVTRTASRAMCPARSS